MPIPLRVMLIASEAAPIISSGELGRAVGGLACALKKENVDVRIMIPKYQQLQTNNSITRLAKDITLRASNRFRDIAIYRDELLPDEVPVYLIERPRFFDREYIYGPPEQAYTDNADRFAFFNLAALEMFTQIGFFPDIVHCHDWHSGLIPAYLKTVFAQDPLYAPIKTLFTIYDMRHQGCFTMDAFDMTALPRSVLTPDGVEFYGKWSFLKAGLVYSDLLNTVSKQYRYEIQTPEFGWKMDGILQKRGKDLYGIINGVEYKPFNPRIDQFIISNYTSDTLEKKRECKEDILEFCGLDPAANRPLLAMIAPLYEEKGIDLLINALDRLMEFPIHLMFLNDLPYRNQRFADALETAFKRHPQFARCYLQFDESLKHRLLAGADFLLMPYQSEPCGVTQMYALKYGTIPLVRATGGLDDTVVDFMADSSKGTGFKFKEFNADALCGKLRDALAVYHNQPLWDLLQANAMRADYRWKYTALKYIDLYHLLKNKAKTNNASS